MSESIITFFKLDLASAIIDEIDGIPNAEVSRIYGINTPIVGRIKRKDVLGRSIGIKSLLAALHRMRPDALVSVSMDVSRSLDRNGRITEI